MGEMLCLTWDCVYIEQDSIECGSASVYVRKELQRVERKTLETLEKKNMRLIFPAASVKTATVMVLKTPKTESSVRKVFMSKAVAQMVAAWKEKQKEEKRVLGAEYQDFDLVFTGSLGLPTEASTTNGVLKRLSKENNLPPVVFHSFRHAGVTCKLKLNGGDMKAVQDDTGHTQAKMVTEVYSHILDDGRRRNARLFQETFYDRKDEQQAKLTDGITPEILEKPEMAALLTSLAQSL